MNDDERLAALFDGRVVGRERDELLARLAASDDDYEVFADTADVLHALEAEDARAEAEAEAEDGVLVEAAAPAAAEVTGDVPRRVGAEAPAPAAAPGVPEPDEPDGALAEASGVLPFRRPERTRPRVPARWVAMAAAAAGVVLVSAIALRGRGGAAPEPVQLAMHLDEGMPEDWTDSRPWAVDRGGSSDAERNARAVRIGVMLTRLAVAVQSDDAGRTTTLATQIAERFASGSGAVEPLERIASQPGASMESRRELVEEATHQLERDNPSAWLRLGAWAEAARLAANRRDEGFFREVDSQEMLDRAVRLAGDDAAARAAVEQVRLALPGGVPRDWITLENSLEALLVEIAS